MTIQDKAKELLDDANSLTLRYTRGTATYILQLLALFLMNSLTSDFAVLLQSCIDPKYRTNGPVFLFMMCAHKEITMMMCIQDIVCSQS
jgi:hypothetical protein